MSNRRILLYQFFLLFILLHTPGLGQGQSLQSTIGQQEEEQEEGSQVLGRDSEVEDSEFVEAIADEAQALPVFGADQFAIDTSDLTAGPIDPTLYLVAPEDKLLLEVWGELNLQQATLTVGSDFSVTVPEVGKVYLAGQTLEQAEITIMRALANIYSSYIDPVDPSQSTAQVELTPVETHPVRFLVQGEVEKPGSYQLHPSLSTLVYCLARAGGISENGSLRNITIRRGNRVLDVDFYDYLLTGSIDQNKMQIQAQDRIFVPLKKKEVSIRGEVRRPGRYELAASETLLDLIDMAGGLRPTASLEKSLILRTEMNRGLQTIDVNLEEVRDARAEVQLQDQDVVNIYSTYLLRVDYVSVKGKGIALPGEYQLREKMRLSDLIEEAGGLTGEAYLDRADLVRTRPDMTRRYENVNLRRVIAGDPNHDVLLENLDEVIIYTVREIEGSERRALLRGHVKNPGNFSIYQGMTLYDLLFAKGGFQDQDFLRRTYKERGDIFRITENGATRKLLKFNLGRLLEGDQDENYLLQDGDEIQIYSIQDVAAQDHFVTLEGHVKSPGRHQLLEDMTLLDLLEVAGGFQDREFRKQTFLDRADLIRLVRRGNEMESELIRFDLGALILGDDSQNHGLQAEDVIVIYAAKDFTQAKTVSIDGLVKNPGTYDYASNMMLSDLLIQAGGLLEGAYARAEISRIDLQGNSSVKRRTFEVDISADFLQSDATNSVELMSNDRVFIRKHPEFEEQEIVTISGEVRFPGRYALRDDEETLATLIERAGGLKPSGYVQAVRFLRLIDSGSTEDVQDYVQAVRSLRRVDSGSTEGVRDHEAIAQEEQYYRVVLNLQAVFESPGNGQDILLRHGDLIEVPRFENFVTVTGAVNTETTIAFEEGKGVDYYIDRAGGLRESAEKKSITLSYPNGEIVKPSSGLFGFGQTKVMPMSVIHVPEKEELIYSLD